MSACAPALFERFPAAAARIPWLSLGVQRTPLERIELAGPAGTRPILVKRDDLTATPYGGNKVRKLEFILADVRARGATRVITAGATGSHHALATTVYARALGLDVTLVLFPQSRTPHVRRTLLLDHALGAELCFTGRMESVPLAVMRARLSHRRQRPYTIAPGGSDPIGTLGYVSAGLELAGQLRAQCERPASVHVAAGTLGTAAGLALGLALAGETARIIATRITSRLVANEVAARRLLERTAALLERAGIAVPLEMAAEMIVLNHDQLGAGYGRETAAGREATRLFAEAGLALDQTYTAKAAASLLASAGVVEGVPLFLHTLSAAEPVERARDVTSDDLPAPFRRYLEG